MTRALERFFFLGAMNPHFDGGFWGGGGRFGNRLFCFGGGLDFLEACGRVERGTTLRAVKLHDCTGGRLRPLCNLTQRRTK